MNSEETRDELIKDLRLSIGMCKTCLYKGINGGCLKSSNINCRIYDEINDISESLLSKNYVKIKTGKWLAHPSISFKFCCSVCNDVSIEKYAHCPNCLAIMNGENAANDIK